MGRGIAAGIPTRAAQEPLATFDRRLINRLERWRRVSTRYEKRAANYLAMATLAAILHWL